ncbi:hypothetical protein DIPPA_05272 [Diplonema papillatum]|nr:hypothetical protein DIPPA_05272 [Diplonema papillatum]
MSAESPGSPGSVEHPPPFGPPMYGSRGFGYPGLPGDMANTSLGASGPLGQSAGYPSFVSSGGPFPGATVAQHLQLSAQSLSLQYLIQAYSPLTSSVYGQPVRALYGGAPCQRSPFPAADQPANLLPSLLATQQPLRDAAAGYSPMAAMIAKHVQQQHALFASLSAATASQVTLGSLLANGVGSSQIAPAGGSKNAGNPAQWTPIVPVTQPAAAPVALKVYRATPGVGSPSCRGAGLHAHANHSGPAAHEVGAPDGKGEGPPPNGLAHPQPQPPPPPRGGDGGGGGLEQQQQQQQQHQQENPGLLSEILLNSFCAVSFAHQKQQLQQQLQLQQGGGGGGRKSGASRQGTPAKQPAFDQQQQHYQGGTDSEESPSTPRFPPDSSPQQQQQQQQSPTDAAGTPPPPPRPNARGQPSQTKLDPTAPAFTPGGRQRQQRSSSKGSSSGNSAGSGASAKRRLLPAAERGDAEAEGEKQPHRHDPDAAAAANDGTARTPDRVFSLAAAQQQSSRGAADGAPLCIFFTRGLCAHGSDCRYSHQYPVIAPSLMPTIPTVNLHPLAPSFPSTPPPPFYQAAPRSSHGNSPQKRLSAPETFDIDSYYLPSSQADARLSDVRPCFKYNAGACTDESWPHKLTHFFDESAGRHETDRNCIYPEPRAYHRTCQVHPKKMWKWEPTTQQWMEASPAPGENSYPPAGRVDVVTYNVLFDHYMKDHIHSRKRYHALAEVLREADFDICCLQEVQPAFLRVLLREDWVRDKYWSSAEAECSSLCFAGVVILSKWALEDLAIHDLPQTCGNVSSAVIGRLALGPALSVTLCSAHLSLSGFEIQTCQLANLLRKTMHHPHVVLLGDFNLEIDLGHGFLDAWIESEAADEGHTKTNPPAALLYQRLQNSEAREPDGIVPEDKRLDLIFRRSRDEGRGAPALRTVKHSASLGGKQACREYLLRRVSASLSLSPAQSAFI